MGVDMRLGRLEVEISKPMERSFYFHRETDWDGTLYTLINLYLLIIFIAIDPKAEE
jgi:hypothetical protein